VSLTCSFTGDVDRRKQLERAVLVEGVHEQECTLRSALTPLPCPNQSEYKDGMGYEDALTLAVKVRWGRTCVCSHAHARAAAAAWQVLMKAMDTTSPTPDKFEVCTLQRYARALARTRARARRGRGRCGSWLVVCSIDGVVVQRVLPDADVAAAVARVVAASASSGDA
jgi:hypothetical protein